MKRVIMMGWTVTLVSLPYLLCWEHLRNWPYLEIGSLQMRASLVAQTEKNPPAMWETWVQSLGWEDPMEDGEATHSSILA